MSKLHSVFVDQLTSVMGFLGKGGVVFGEDTRWRGSKWSSLVIRGVNP